MINKIYKSVLITGASSGIGLETLKRFFKEKIKIYALDKDISALEKLRKKYKFEIFQIDLFDTDQIYEKLTKLNVDIVVCNAGIGKGAEGILKASRQDIELSTRLNVESYLHILKVIVPGMIKRRKGHVVLMGSLAGLYPQMSLSLIHI